ncbi:MAG: beta-ketoacyl-ACP synthase II [Rickettsiaceae bacterium H1]|nr:beta-ketoacyl-ACP synthase II [Rickettsiaceae bacterium H1]
MNEKRVVITGIGLVTPLANGVQASWDLLLKGNSGISKIDEFPTNDLACKIAGKVPLDGENPFDIFKYFPNEKDHKKVDKFIAYGIGAAQEAIEDSGILGYSSLKRDRVGVLIGSGIGGLPLIEKTAITLREKGARRVSPFFIPASLINLASGHVSIMNNFTGPNESTVTACSTGAHAVIQGSRLIMLGEADVMVVGSSEGAICRLGIAGFSAMKALSTHFNDDPESASRPWDKDRDGFVMGEGAGVLILEDYEHAKKRGADIYGEVAGYGESGDAYHIAAPETGGKGAFQAMRSAVSKSGISLQEIGYVNAHGTSTPAGDLAEIAALECLFGSDISKIAISSTKSSVGHLLGAAGSVEAIFSILAMRDSILPPTLNLDNPDEIRAEINLVPNQAQEKDVKVVLSNSFGFGGTNASLLFKII